MTDVWQVTSRATGLSPEEIRSVVTAAAEKQREADERELPPPGTAITLSAASRKYHVALPTLSRWVSRGLIYVIEDLGPGRPLRVDERDLARAVKHYERTGPGKGSHAITTFA